MQRMLTAITRGVSPAINRCELGYLPRVEIDVAKAAEQHRRYEASLAELGASVISLDVEPDLPDSVFVEDPAVVVEEVAVMTRMGAESRREEGKSLARALAQFRPLHWLEAPATLEGGDVLRIGRKVFVGLSARTNREGVEQLARLLEPLAYTVRGVEVRGCLHLKTACSHAGEDAILANREWFDTSAFDGFRLVDVAAGEPRAANVLAMGETVLMADCFPATALILEGLGRKVVRLDNSELMKAEAGLTCSSLIFETKPILKTGPPNR
jgi:dimethylargininase